MNFIFLLFVAPYLSGTEYFSGNIAEIAAGIALIGLSNVAHEYGHVCVAEYLKPGSVRCVLFGNPSVEQEKRVLSAVRPSHRLLPHSAWEGDPLALLGFEAMIIRIKTHSPRSEAIIACAGPIIGCGVSLFPCMVLRATRCGESLVIFKMICAVSFLVHCRDLIATGDSDGADILAALPCSKTAYNALVSIGIGTAFYYVVKKVFREIL